MQNFSKRACVPECRSSLFGPFKVSKYTSSCLDYCGNLHKYEEATKEASLHVVVTTLPMFRSLRLSAFDSQHELKSSLMASAAAFPLAGLVKHPKHGWCLDGGLSDFQPIFDRDTITVNPFFFSSSDIRPSRYIPAWWAMLPPSDPATIDWMYDLGYCDALNFFKKVGLVDCDHMHEGSCR